MDNKPNILPCRKCYLRYSSYCIGCKYEPYGLGYTSTIDYIRDKKGIKK